ncbi:Hypothetical protein A7982_08385 [Minicystis rosea]|nr:Hypothetical protein A7982_08385 [Minicystis rosea]
MADRSFVLKRSRSFSRGEPDAGEATHPIVCAQTISITEPRQGTRKVVCR